MKEVEKNKIDAEEKTCMQRRMEWDTRMVEKSMLVNGLTVTSKILIKQLTKGAINEEEYILRTRILFDLYEKKKEEFSNAWKL